MYGDGEEESRSIFLRRELALRDEDRDELFIRLDENVKAVKIVQIETARHLASINSKVQEHELRLSSVCNTVYGQGGDKGLCGAVRRNASNIVKLFCVAIASAAIGGGTSELVHLLIG